MAKSQAISDDKKHLDLGSEYSGVSDKKPNWVNLAQLDGPLEDSLTNRFLYKPALRFHGITGGIWGQGLSDAHSVTSESRPPSYRFVDSAKAQQHGGDGCSTCDADTIYNTMNIPAQSPLTLRRRNTVAVIVVAIALLATVAAITGIILHFLHPKAMLRANVRFTIANKNYTDDMKNSSSLDFNKLSRPLCEEMDVYFLTSELADFYLGCNVVSLKKAKSKTKTGTDVHYTLDFIENKVTNDGERIKKIIMRKSGRHKTEDTLFLAIRDFLVYLRSLKVDVEVMPLPDDHPGRRHRPRIPWNEDIDFIARLPKSPGFSDIEDMKRILRHLVDNMYNMTTKIDHMQDAINFINKTFHETHRPLFNLEETLGNMTLSLSNLNQNLNSINSTMNAFKDFLKQFGNNVFNIDDVIKHIDDTIGNLENAVSFIEFSMVDINGTVNGISDNIVDMNNTLTYVSRSVLDVNYTASYSNDTLDSMQKTLISLEDAIKNLSLKVNIINNESDMFDISLKNINDTVKNTHGKLNRLHGKLQKFNSSMTRVVEQAQRLNETYIKINKTLENMNEPFMFINGTVLEVIEKLSSIDGRLLELCENMDVAKSNITVMNESLLASMDWLEEMVKTLTKFNLWIESNDDTLQISLRNKDIIETVGMLLNMNGTLHDIGHDVDHINVRLDKVDVKLENLEQQLYQIDRTLDDIDVKFKLLDKTLKSINTTVKDTDSSLNVINSTIKAMENIFENGKISFTNINETLDAVNKTLTKVNKSADEINSTITNVNKTFNGLEITVDRTTDSAIKLKESIPKFKGTVRELNAQLYNANESMRITVNKADIATKSFLMLNETLTEVGNTVAELRIKLDDTNTTLLNTNASLGFVNNSILSLQSSFQILSTDLSKIQDSFLKMNDSMHGFRNAFPTIQTSIQGIQDASLKLQEEISQIEVELKDSKDKRDILVSKKTSLFNRLKEIIDRVDVIKSTLEEVKNRSSEIENNVVVLNDSVNEAIKLYNKTEENIKYINDTHDAIRELYDTFQKDAIQTNNSLNALGEEVNSLSADFEECRKRLENYSNIDVKLDIISSEIDNEYMRYKNVKENFDKWEQNYRTVDNIIWDNNGIPSKVHSDFNELVNGTEMVNKTVNIFGQVLTDTDKEVKSMINFNKDKRFELKKMYNLQSKIDEIDHLEVNLTKKISETEKILNDKHAYITQLKEDLLAKFENIENMKEKFGNINGTFNASESFTNLEKDIRSALSDVNTVLDSLKNSSKLFQKFVQGFNEANVTYHSNIYDLTEKSETILNNTLEVMKNTTVQNYDVRVHLQNISDTLEAIQKRINNSTSEINSFEKTLDYQKRRNNFISSKRPLLEEAYQRAFKKLDEITEMQGILSKELKSLENTSSVIEERIKEKPNINITIIKEKTYINESIGKIRDFRNDMSTSNIYLDTFYDRFLNFDESNHTLEEIQKEYAQHFHAVEHFETVVKDIPSVQTDIYTNTTKISKTFEDLLNQLSELLRLEEPVRNASVTVKEVKSKLENSWNSIHDAESHLSWLKEEFSRIKSNYTNFTATEIDLTESYVIEAMDGADKLLSNLTVDLLEVNGSVQTLQNTFGSLKQIYTQKMYNSSNINSTIQNIIVPTLQNISVDSEMIKSDLDSINSKISWLDLAIKGMNETIHVTNKQLFIDRQKQLLADTTFPEMEKSTENANHSITNSLKRLNETKDDLNAILTSYENLNKRLKNYPHINISLDDFGKKLHNFNESISSTLEKLNSNNDLLNVVNTKLWTKDGKRYSNNETVDDMKKRYKVVDEMLKEIFIEMNNLNSVIDAISNGSQQIAAKISSLNETLDGVDDSNKHLDKLYREFTPLNIDFNDTKSKVNYLTGNFSGITNAFKTIRNRFKNINQEVYKENVNQFDENQSSVNKSLSLLKKMTNITSNDLERIQEIFDLITAITNKTSNSQNEIKEYVHEQNKLLKNISELLSTVGKSITDLKHNSTLIEPSIYQLNNDSSEIEKKFYRQEKIDYFEKYFPKKAYDSLNDTLKSVKKANMELGSQSKRIAKHFDELESNLTEHKNMNFNISQTYNSLSSTDMLVLNNSKVLGNISNDYLQLNSLFYAEDGFEVSDTETIDDMKKRYKTIDERMDNMTSELQGLKDNIAQQNLILEQSAETIDEYRTLIASFENVSRNVYEMQKINEKWNDTANTIRNLNLERNSTFSFVRKEYESICDAFNETNNESIRQLKTKIDNNIERLSKMSNSLSESGAEILHNVSLAENITNSYNIDLLDNHVNSDQLRSILLKYDDVVIYTNETTTSLPQMNKTLAENGTIVDDDLSVLQNDVENLRHMLIKQEKQDYIDRNVPVLEHLLQKAKSDINKAHNEKGIMAEKLKTLQAQYDLTSEITSNISSLEIPLINSANLIGSANNISNRYESVLNSGKQFIENLDESILFRNGSYFSVNDTLEEIKNVFEGMKMSLQNVSANMSNIIEKKNVLIEDLNKENNYLKELCTEGIKLLNLAKTQKESKQELKALGNEIDNSVMNASQLADGKIYLDNRLADIVNAFKNVKKKSLYNDVNMILNELIKLGDGHTVVNASINSTVEEHMATLDKSNIVEKTMNNISNNLNELKRKTNKSKEMHDEIIERVISTNNKTNENAESLARMLDMIPLINESLSKLQENFRKQEIHEYIKENVPSLVKNYDHVNRTLSDLNERIARTARKMINVRNKSIEVEQQFNDFHSIDISFEDVVSAVEHINVSLKDVIHDKIRLEGIFKDMENVISNSVNSNETLEEIKKRFLGYESILQSLSTNMTELNNTVSEIDIDMNQIQNNIENHTNALDNFLIVQADAVKEEQSLEKLRELITNVENNLNMIKLEGDLQKSQYDLLSARFEEVNNTFLINERTRIGRSIISFNDSLTETQRNFTTEKIKYETLMAQTEILKQDLNQTVTTIEQLKAVTDNAVNKTILLSNNRRKITTNIENDIIPKVAPYNDTIDVIEGDINNLREKFLEQEKSDYLLSHLPKLKHLYDYVNKSLAVTKNNIQKSAATNDRLNKTIETIQQIISSFKNIKISTDKDLQLQQILQENITAGNSEVNEAMVSFMNIDTEIFERKDWTNISIDRIKDECNELNKTLSMLNNTLSNVNSALSISEDAQNKSLINLDGTMSVLDRYKSSLNTSSKNEEELHKLSGKLNETYNLLEDVKERYYHDGDRLFNLTRKYSGTTSSSIEKMIDEIRTIIEGTVALRIPLANKLFSKRIMENYNVASAKFHDVDYILNDNYTSKDQIENILGDVDDTLMNITLETENLMGDEEFYREDAVRLSEHLNNSNSLLDKLEEMLKVQAKLDILHKNIPKLKSYWNEVNNSLYSISDRLPVTSEYIEDALIFAKDLNDKIDQIVTIDISTDNIHSNLSFQESLLKKINESTGHILGDLNEIRLNEIDVNALADNKSVTLLEVQDTIANLTSSIDKLRNRTNDLVASNADLKRNLFSTKGDMMVLNKTIEEFQNTEKDASNLQMKLNQTFDKLNETESKLKKTDDEINVYKSSLKALKERYKAFQYDSNEVDVLVNMSEKTIEKLNKSLSSAKIMLTESKDEYDEIKNVLYNKTDDLSKLNDSIEQIKKLIPPTLSKVIDVNKSLDNITDNIPTLDNVLEDIGGMIREMNVSLINEDVKSNFAERALPLLKEKYERTNRTFEMTNKTLQRMADEIDMLNEYIETLKLRMSDFSTINISLSDIDANITHLENRLAIMKEHYDNVKGIVNKFRKDISVNNIFGRNISLSDVEDQYKTFNDSLDLIDEVLAKIDNEAYKMDEHFEFLNDTMSGIDHALDRFETKQMNTKIMEKDIETIGNELSFTNKRINGMQDAVNDFSDRFEKMNVLYADVLQSTAENNTLVNKLLETTNKSLAGLKSSMDKLNDIHDKVTKGFVDMNGTLFGYIDTYNGLNVTLDDVKSKYLLLSKSLTQLEKDINDAAQEADGKNTTLSELSKLLDLINETLYKEKVKFDFIKDNLGNLAEKFNSIKNPLETTNKTLSDVTDNIFNTSDLVKKTGDKLQNFPNVHISLLKDIETLSGLDQNISKVNTKLKDLDNNYEILKKNISDLDDRSEDVANIQEKYKSVNESLDKLQTNLTDMTAELEEINEMANSISTKTIKLNTALDKLGKLNNSIVSVAKNVSKLESDFETTGFIINETYSDANNLHEILGEMKGLYSTLGDDLLLGNLTDLIEKLNTTTVALKGVKAKQKKLKDKADGTIKTLKETENQLNGDIYNQEMLDKLNNNSEESLNRLRNETFLLRDSQDSIVTDVNELQNTIDVLTNEILRLNDTLAEEKKKREFIAKNFPDMQKRYENVNKILDNSNSSLIKANQKTDTVAKRLSAVKERLNNITAITIPLDSENKEVLRIKKAVNDVLENFENTSKVYDGLKLDHLNQVDTKYHKLKDRYVGFDKTLNDIEQNIIKMNGVLTDINKTASVINESVNDINSTVDEYVESGEMINEYAKSAENLASNIGSTNHSVGKLSDKIQDLHDTLNTLLKNYSHINDPSITQAQNIIKSLLNSSSDTINKIGKEILNLNADSEKARSLIQEMNQTHMTTKNLLSDLKQHIKDIKNNSSNANASISGIESQNVGINKSIDDLSPNLKNILDKISNLNDTLVKEQVKLDFIAANKPLIEKKFRDLLGPLEKTNNHISFTEVKLVDLKYEIQSTGARLDKFKTLNITTDPELQLWNKMNHTVKNVSKSFQDLNDKYKELQSFLKTLDDRNISIDEMKRKFTNINNSLDDIESKLESVNTKLSKTENKIRVTENTIGDLQTSMDKFKLLQTEALKTKQKVNNMKTFVGRFENSTNDLGKDGAGVKQNVEDMKTTYAILNNTKWNEMMPIFDKELSTGINRLNEVNKSLSVQRSNLESTANTFDQINSEISNRSLTRKDVDSAISNMHNRLNATKQQLSKLDKPLKAYKEKIRHIDAAMNQTKSNVDAMNKTLHNELLKHDYVKHNLPSLKEKYVKVNASYVKNIPNVQGMQDQISQLVSIIERIKEKMRQYGVDDTDNAIKKWDLAIQSLNATVENVLRKNREAGNKLIDLKEKLWSKDKLYSSNESLADVITRFDNYNKTLDEINAASHTINIKLADLGAKASGVIGQLLERDSILTTTPATTTPSGPPDWLTFQSTATGVIGKDTGFATCAVEDLTQWEMMKITRVNKDGREEAIAAWKLGVGARKAVRDRRIKVKRTKTATGGKMTVGIQTLQCEDEGTYYCSIDSYNMWPLQSSIGVITPPEDDLKPEFPTEVFEDKVANFSCTGHPGYPNGRITWKIKREKEVEFRPFDFYSSRPKVTDTSCVRTETNTVEYQFDLQWNNTKVRCYIENTDFYAEGIIRLLPYDICNKVRYLGTISHPYTPHKYIVCGKELNIMQCPGNTCYDQKEENCVRCKAGSVGSDPCLGQPLFSYVAHETDCKKYYICMGPTKNAKKCTKGYFAPNIPGNCVMSYAQSHCGRKAG